MSIVTVEEFCDWTEVDEDAVAASVVELIIDAAQDLVEQYCGREFEQDTFTEYHDLADKSTNFIYVENPPINSITSLQYEAQDDSPETVDADDRITDSSAGKITLYEDESYFSRGDAAGEQSVKVVYSGGYSAADMPAPVRMATLLAAQFWWDHRDEIGLVRENMDGQNVEVDWSGLIPAGARSLLAPYRKVVSV